jgi:L-asparagine transporter-like permease
MLALRLVIAALTSLIAGAAVAWIAPSSPRVPVLVGATLLAAFIPVHVRVFSLFPLWYHLVFLVTLIPLVMLGAWLARGRGLRGAPAGGTRA